MKSVTLLLLSFVVFSAHAQKADAQLQSRLNDYLRLTKEMNFDKAFDYMHPKLFTIAPKEQLVKSIEAAFQNPALSFRFDSLAIVSIGPPVKIGAETYRKIVYYGNMTMTFQSDSLNLKNEGFATAVSTSMKNGFPGKKILVDTSGNRILVSGTDIMFAIKDSPSSEWMFLGYEPKNPALVKKLFPAAVWFITKVVDATTLNFSYFRRLNFCYAGSIHRSRLQNSGWESKTRRISFLSSR